MIEKWIDYLSNTEITDSPESILLVISIIIIAAAICILMFICFKKCVHFGKLIGHGVISFNIILFAVPMLIFAIIITFKMDMIPWYIMLIITAICWGIAIIRDITICKTHFGYTIGYIFFQLLIGFLLSSVIISIAAVIILAFFIIIAAFNAHTDIYDISLVPIDEVSVPNNIIRAKRNDSDPNILDGEHGERFEHVSGNQYMLVFSLGDLSDCYKLYCIY